MQAMTKWERVMAAVKGEPVDRIPMSFYNHNHLMEASTNKLARYLLSEQNRFDWDFLKATFRPSYYAEAWGCQCRFYPDKVPEILNPLIKSAKDYRELKNLDPTKGVFGEHIGVTKQLKEGLNKGVPLVVTVFSPLSIAGRIAGGVVRTPSESETLRNFIQEDSESVLYGLSVITQTLAGYVREVIRAGADGIYMSTTVWSKDVMTEDEYRLYGLPYDLSIYKAAIDEGAKFNILHICRDNIMLSLLSDYPVEVINFDARSPRNPSLGEALKMTRKALWGGINHKTTLVEGSAASIAEEVHSAIGETEGRRIILGPGCTSLSPIKDDSYLAVKKAVERKQAMR